MGQLGSISGLLCFCKSGDIDLQMRVPLFLLISTFSMLVSSSDNIFAKICRPHLKKLADDPYLFDQLGCYAQIIPAEDLEIFERLVKDAYNHIMREPLPSKTAFMLSEKLKAISLPKDIGSKFITYTRFVDCEFSVSVIYFFKDAKLRVVFLEGNTVIAGGFACCANEGFEAMTLETYEAVTTILAHPNFQRALNFLEVKYKIDQKDIKEAMIMNFLELHHPNHRADAWLFKEDMIRDYRVASLSYTNTFIGVWFANAPFSLEVINGQLKIHDRKNLEVRYKTYSKKEIAAEIGIWLLILCISCKLAALLSEFAYN
jgi:hypothetical protein